MLKYCKWCKGFFDIEDLLHWETYKRAPNRYGCRVYVRYAKESKRPPIPLEEASPSLRYRRSLKGLIRSAYIHIKQRTSGKHHKDARGYVGLEVMDKEVFIAWATEDAELKRLHDIWVKSGFDRKLTPTVDRLDTSKGYVEGNIRWLSKTNNCILTKVTKEKYGMDKIVEEKVRAEVIFPKP